MIDTRESQLYHANTRVTCTLVLSALTCKEMDLVKRIHAVKPSTFQGCQQKQSSQASKASQDTPTNQQANSSSQSAESHEILKEYTDVFDGLGCLPDEHTIKTDPTVTPVVRPPRRVPLAFKGKIKEELQRMEEAGVVVRLTDPTDWVNSMVTVMKPNKIRICIDPRDLNKAIKREHYPMKTIKEVIAEMPQAQAFSVLNATKR